ncbi:MAG: MarC family protein [Opitutales bacterium]
MTCLVLLLQGEAADWVQNAIVYAVILLVCGVSYGILALSAKGAGWVSPILLKIIQRLAGLLVATLAVQFVVNGVSTILRDLGMAG